MANICVLSGWSSSDVRVSKFTGVLTTASHTWSVVSDANYATTDFSSYDLIVFLGSTQSRWAGLAEKLVDLSESGKPIIIGGPHNGIDAVSGDTLFAVQVGIDDLEKQRTGWPKQPVITPNATGAAHAILTGYTADTAYNVTDYAVWQERASALMTPPSSIMTVLATIDGSNDNANIAIAEPGKDLLNGRVLRTRLVYIGWLGCSFSSSQNFTTAGVDVITRSIDWALATTLYDEAQVTSQAFRAYAVVGPPQDGVSAETFRAYAVVGPSPDGVTAEAFRAYAVIQTGRFSVELAHLPTSDVHPLTVTNGNAEAGNMTGWTNTTGAIVVQSGGGSTGGAYEGTYNFAGGTVASSIARQDIAIPSGFHADVDDDQFLARVTWMQGGWASDSDTGGIHMDFLDGSSNIISSSNVTLTTVSVTGWVAFENVNACPAGTRTIRLRMQAQRASGTNNDVYFDSIEVALLQLEPVVKVASDLTGAEGAHAQLIRVTDSNGNQFTKAIDVVVVG